MGGVASILQIGESGLRNQQFGINVAAHNITNLQTEGYSRQTAELSAQTPLKSHGLALGQGVEVDQIIRNVDEVINKRLAEHISDLNLYQELEYAMLSFEGLFSETGANDESSISTILSEFANSWQTLANNPSGLAERTTLLEQSRSLTERFVVLDEDLKNIRIDLTRTISASLKDINVITGELAEINMKLYGMEADSVLANDMRDKRDKLITDLYELIDVRTYAQENGFVNVTTSRGAILVNGIDSYDLEMIGDQKTGLGQIAWKNSSGATMDITDYITEGQIGGWLKMRDEIIGDGITTGFRKDFNDVAKEFIWKVNEKHSEGVGIKLFDADTKLTGTYYTTDENSSVAGLTYGVKGKVDFGTPREGETKAVPTGFDLWIGDSSGNNIRRIEILLATPDSIGTKDVQIFSFETSTVDIADSINRQIEKALGKPIELCGVSVSVPDPEDLVQSATEAGLEAASLLEEEQVPEGEDALQAILDSVTTLKFVSDSTSTFGFSNDTSNILAAYGINTFFTGSTISNIKVNSVVDNTSEYIAAGYIKDMKDVTYNVSLPFQVTDNGSTGRIDTEGPYTGDVKGLYALRIEANADNKDDIQYKLHKFEDKELTDGEDLLAAFDWETETTLYSGKDPVTTDDKVKITFPNGDFQYIAGETYLIEVKAGGVVSPSSNENAFELYGLVESVQDDYNQVLTSIGIRSLTISREKDIVEVATDQLSELRDNISGVSLDEEFTTLIEFQRAYQAAAKIIKTTDEMLQTALGLLR